MTLIYFICQGQSSLLRVWVLPVCQLQVFPHSSNAQNLKHAGRTEVVAVVLVVVEAGEVEGATKEVEHLD